MGGQNVKPGNVGNGALQQFLRIGRVQENNIKLLPHALEILHRVSADHFCLVAQLRSLQIFTDQGHGVLAPVHKHGTLRSPGEALDAKLAGTGKKVQHLPSLDIELQGAEHSLLHPVGGGTGLHALQFLESAAPGGACDDTHMVLLIVRCHGGTVSYFIYFTAKSSVFQ